MWNERVSCPYTVEKSCSYYPRSCCLRGRPPAASPSPPARAGKKAGDYHGEMNSTVWLKSLESKVLPKIKRVVLVVDRAPYHMVLTEGTCPVSSKSRKAQIAGWFEKHGADPDDWNEEEWRTTRTRAEMKAQADNHRPTPSFLVQDLTAKFHETIQISPVAHPELNPIELVWGTMKAPVRRASIEFSLAWPKELVAIECERITSEVLGR